MLGFVSRETLRDGLIAPRITHAFRHRLSTPPRKILMRHSRKVSLLTNASLGSRVASGNVTE